jgi:hypothetical protein
MDYEWLAPSSLIATGSLLAALVAAAYSVLAWHARPRAQLSVDLSWQDTWYPAGADQTPVNGITYLWVRVTNISAISAVDVTVTVSGALREEPQEVGVMLPGAFESTTVEMDLSSPGPQTMKLTWVDLSRSKRRHRMITSSVPPYLPERVGTAQVE